MPSATLPRFDLIDETMREGMQIESVDISVDDKISLIDAISRTGLQKIVVGSFVSPKWVPQMSRVTEIVTGFTPVPGVEYRALALNAEGVRRRAELTPPLTLVSGAEAHTTRTHLCDVFARRNTNRGQADEIAGWPAVIERAVAVGAPEAGIALSTVWGSNWSGPYTPAERMDMLGRQYALWQAAGIPVVRVWLGDPMGWNTPSDVAAQVAQIAETWPSVRTFHLHLHNQRGLALTSAWAAAQALGPNHTLVLDTAIGGIGGCPYCGNGRATGMIPTEDMVHLLHAEGVETGVDIDRLLDVNEQLTAVLGRMLDSHVGRAGPRPIDPSRRYAPDLPLIESFDDARHFRQTPPTRKA